LGTAVQKPSPQVPAQKPALQVLLRHSRLNRHGLPGFSVPEAKQKPAGQKLLAQSASSVQGDPFEHLPQSA
jgi:hypothetical protein